jgi:hypothetical protein
MKGTEMFCSACDRQVRVMISEAPSGEHQATVHDDELICLEIGEHCTGNLCPLGAAEPNAMVSRIVRNGLPTDGLRTVMATCPACDLHAEIVLYGEGKAACTACGTPARWVAEHVLPLE